MNALKQLIRDIANRQYLKKAYENVGLNSYGNNPFKLTDGGEAERQLIADTFKPLLKTAERPACVPEDSLRFTVKVECDGQESPARGYYPEHSFYRLAIQLSGHTDEKQREGWQYASGTYHFDRDMNFIKYQPHVAFTYSSMKLSLVDIPELTESTPVKA